VRDDLYLEIPSPLIDETWYFPDWDRRQLSRTRYDDTRGKERTLLPSFPSFHFLPTSRSCFFFDLSFRAGFGLKRRLFRLSERASFARRKNIPTQQQIVTTLANNFAVIFSSRIISIYFLSFVFPISNRYYISSRIIFLDVYATLMYTHFLARSVEIVWKISLIRYVESCYSVIISSNINPLVSRISSRSSRNNSEYFDYPSDNRNLIASRRIDDSRVIASVCRLNITSVW